MLIERSATVNNVVLFIVFLVIPLTACVRFDDLPPPTENEEVDSETDSASLDTDSLYGNTTDYDTVSLIPKDGSIQIDKDDNVYGIQGSWYYYEDGVFSHFDTDGIPEISLRNGEGMIQVSGNVKKQSGNNYEQWGVGFGIEFCVSTGDDCQQFGNIDGSDRLPCVPEYVYPLKGCPFGENLHKKIVGIRFKVGVPKGKKGFGKLEVQFKQGSETGDNYHPRCYIYENDTDSNNEEGPLCGKIIKRDRIWNVTALVNEVEDRNGEKAFPELIRAIHFGIATGTSSELSERDFEFSLQNIQVLLGNGNSLEGGPELDRECPNNTTSKYCDEKPECLIGDKDWVKVKDFYIMKKEATVAQILQFLDMTGSEYSVPEWYSCNLHKYRKETNQAMKADLDEQAANCIEYCLAEAFCKWIKGYVPDELQWMTAARSGDYDSVYLYPWSWNNNLKESKPNCSFASMDNANDEDCGEKAPHKGCMHQKGNTEQGVCDMSGNLAEWISSPINKDYFYFKQVKGGYFYSREQTLTIESRSMEHMKKPYNYIRMGVRCAKDNAMTKNSM